MGRSQPIYILAAGPRCTTHKPGSRIEYTGPRSNIPRGWRVVAGPFRPEYGGGLA